MSMKIVSAMAERELSSDEITLVGNLMKRYNLSDADYIITKLVINGWPINENEINRCLRFDKFCYRGAIGIKCDCDCDREHSNKFNIKKLFGDGGRNVNVGSKRRAFYLCYYLFKYCGYKNSKEFRPIMKQFNNKFRKDIDYNSFKIRYKNNWFINSNNNNNNSVYNGQIDNSDCKTECTETTNYTEFTEFTEYSGYTEYTENTEKTDDTTDTTVSLLSNDFYREWEYVMKIGCNQTEFYFSV